MPFTLICTISSLSKVQYIHSKNQAQRTDIFISFALSFLSTQQRKKQNEQQPFEWIEWKKEWAFLYICMDHCECEPKSQWYKSVLWLGNKGKSERENNNTHTCKCILRAHTKYMHKWPEEKVGKLCGYVFLVCKQRANDKTTTKTNLPICVLYRSLRCFFCECYCCFFCIVCAASVCRAFRVQCTHSNETIFLQKTLAQFTIFKLKKPMSVS